MIHLRKTSLCSLINVLCSATVGFTVIGSPLSSQARAEPPAVPSLCRNEEQIIFSCAVARSPRIVSICGSKLLDHRNGYLQYRFGRVGAVELQFPRDRANTQIAFRYAHYFRAQVDRTEITFHNQNYTYVLFSYYENDINPPIKEAGVRVTRHNSDGTEAELKCRENPVSHIGVLESVIPRDNDNPLNQ